ncbi:MAG: adenine deaminase [Caldiserica bacterium]|jgi:adenine deaminase|nr:adenine deaminase [Caldisericota bacterium]MDH7563182.1 adenine deaminase [Caldisericota bacterium]
MQFCREKLGSVSRTLARTAMGEEKADLVLIGGKLINVCSGEILERMDVSIKGSRIAYVGPDASFSVGEGTEVLDVKGMYLSPGFLDGHVHVESSMLTIRQFASAVLPHGTTGIFWDPHEIANVFGLKGVKLMLEDSRGLPLQVFMEIPSCVPSCPGFETSGAQVSLEDISEALSWEGVIGLGEVMNFPGVISGDPFLHEAIARTLEAGKVVTGHYSSRDLGRAFQAYAASGIGDCHEGVSLDDARSRIRAGMYALIRFGSAWHDIKENIKAVTEARLDSRFICLVSDDRHPETLLSRGHMDDVLREAIGNGVPPIMAIQMATLNTASNFGISRDFGSVSPSRFADIVVLEDLKEVKINSVIACGRVVYREGQLLTQFEPFPYPEEIKNSVKLRDLPREEDFRIPVQSLGHARVRIIEVIENQVLTRHRVFDLPVLNGFLSPSPELDVAKIAVLERHHKSGNIGLGFVKGLRIRRGAIASTVSHDCHNLLVCGMSDREMARACAEVVRMGGGMAVILGDQVLARVELPIGGLMSDEPVEVVSAKVRKLGEGLKEIGCDLNSAMMTFSLLALPVIPELRLTDRGLFDSVTFQPVPILV